MTSCHVLDRIIKKAGATGLRRTRNYCVKIAGGKNPTQLEEKWRRRGNHIHLMKNVICVVAG